jgi:hypothetical protein
VGVSMGADSIGRGALGRVVFSTGSCTHSLSESGSERGIYSPDHRILQG